MDRLEASTLLRSLSNALDANADISASGDGLLQILDRLLLVIAQAAASIRKTGITTEACVKRLDSMIRLLNMLDASFVDRYRESDMPNSVVRTWFASLKCIDDVNAFSRPADRGGGSRTTSNRTPRGSSREESP